MRFCPDHWQALQDAIDKRGLTALVAESGQKAASNLASEMESGTTIDNFDPLMFAHNMIVANAMESIRSTYQQNPLMLMADESDPAVTWPTCPICALNWCVDEHDRICTKEGCDYPKGYRWDEAIDIVADATLAKWKELAA